VPNFEESLRQFYLKLPEGVRPALKHGYHWSKLHGSSVVERKPIVHSHRIEFLDFEIAYLEEFGFLGPAPGQVLVDTHVSVVSPGTERGILVGLPGTARRFPFRPGYSAAGVVRAVGAGVTAFKPGDRVAGGIPHASRVNVESSTIVKTPDAVSDADAAFVVLAMIVMQGVRKAQIRPGERVAVIGQGLLGQIALRLARLLTPGRLVAVAATRARADVARASGADAFVALGETPHPIPGDEADVVIEIAGTPSSMSTAVRWATPGGRIVVVGSTRAVDRGIDWKDEVQRKRVTILGAHMSLVPGADTSAGRWTYQQECALFLDLLAQRRLQVNDLVTLQSNPRDCNRVYDRLVHHPSEQLGIAFQWQGFDAAAPRATSAPSVIVPKGDRMQPLRIGIVGAGAIGRHNAVSAKQSPLAQIAGVFDTNAKAARDVAKQVAAPVFDSYEALLADPGIEAVLLSVPHHLHREMTLQAAAARKHLMLEKPLANTLEDADAMVAACQASGMTTTVNFSFRYLAQFQAARAMVAAGALGDITGVQVTTHSYREYGYWLGARSHSVDDWRTDKTKAGAGFLFMNLCHVIDYIHFITGLKTDRLYAEYGTMGSPTEVEDTVSISCRFRNGAIGSFAGTTTKRGGNEAEDRIWGTHGSLSIAGDTISVYSTREIDGRRPGKMHRVKCATPVNWTKEWVTGFAQAVRTGSTPPVTLREGWDNLAFIETALRSMVDGRALSVPQFGAGD
jgi:predicted dehydrogenase